MANSDDSPVVHRFPGLETLSRAVARDLVADIERVLRTQDTYALGLAGGSTPERLYELLAAEAEGTLPWGQIHLFWGDERYVSPDHPKSNARMAGEALIERVPIPAAHVHPMPTELGSAEAVAQAYEDTLRSHFPDRSTTFDTVLLGLGSDGHTASLFPESFDSPRDDDRWVRVVDAPPRHDVSTRLTCTLPVLNRAQRACFLVSGARKRTAVRGVLDRRDPALPATHVRPQGECIWYVDHAARPEGEFPAVGAA